MSDEKRTVRFNFSFSADVSLSVEQIWPDGDAPENPTVDDVLDVIEQSGGKDRIFRDWDLDHEISLLVSDRNDCKEAP